MGTFLRASLSMPANFLMQAALPGIRVAILADHKVSESLVPRTQRSRGGDGAPPVQHSVGRSTQPPLRRALY